jgi:hypothetical protein
MAAKRPKGAALRATSGSREGRKGKSTKDGDLRLLARDAALAALKRLADLSRSEDERIALAATQELLNRAFGKASAAATEEIPAMQPLIIRIVKFSDSIKTQGGRDS